LATSNKNFKVKNGLDATGDITTSGDVKGNYLRSLNSSGDEGGEITLGKPQTNTTLNGTGVTIDVYQNRLRIFEQGGSARGAYIDLTAAATGVGSNLLAGGSGGGAEVIVSTTAPTSPVSGLFWYDPTGSGALSVWADGGWVDIALIADLSDYAEISYVDQEISDLDTLAQGYADTAEESARDFTDALIGDATVDGSGGNTVTDRIASAVSGLVDSSPSTLNTLNELAAALNDDPSFATTVSTSIGTKVSKAGDTMTGLLVLSGEPTIDFHAATKQYVDLAIGSVTSAFETADSDILADLSTINTSIGDIENSIVTINNNADTLSSEVDTISTDVTTLETDLGGVITQVNGISTDVTEIETTLGTLGTDLGTLEDAVDLKSPIESPTFTGTVVLPGTTSIGTITSSEIGHLSGVTSSIQDQIDDKLDSTTASSTYAPLNDPTFGGTVSLPNTTSIGDVSAAEIGYLDGVTSSIQTQLTDLDTTKADIESPTFTGTVSGITSSMVGLGNVDNTSDLDKPISTDTQAALDAKLNLAGGTMTGKITLDGDPTQALHAVTKQYVDSVEAGLITRPAVRAATTSNLTGTYTNGTAGVNAQLNLGQLATLNIDGVTDWSQYNGILVKNQTNAFENGRYVVLQIGNDTDTDWILKRCPLCDEADEIPGSYIFVTDGSANEQTGWVQHVDDPATFTVGTDDIDIYQFAGAGSVTAGTNVSVDGNQVSVIDAPVFTGIVDASAAGVEFSDGVQTKAGVPSLTTFVEKTANYTLDTLAHQDNLVEMNSTSPMTFTIPTNATLAWPIGASMDILQTNTGEVTIAAAGGVTLNRTPGNKLRTQWSSATILKRGTDSWILYGDLKA